MGGQAGCSPRPRDPGSHPRNRGWKRLASNTKDRPPKDCRLSHLFLGQRGGNWGHALSIDAPSAILALSRRSRDRFAWVSIMQRLAARYVRDPSGTSGTEGGAPFLKPSDEKTIGFQLRFL